MTFLHFSDDMQTYDFFTFFRRHANLWLFYIFQTTCKPMTFFPVFGRHTKRHTNLWIFSQFSDDTQNDIEPPRWKVSLWMKRKQGPAIWQWLNRTKASLLYGERKYGTKMLLCAVLLMKLLKFCIEYSCFFFVLYDFFPVFRPHTKRHTNLWLFYQFSDGIKNDIQTYDFFTSFPTA